MGERIRANTTENCAVCEGALMKEIGRRVGRARKGVWHGAEAVLAKGGQHC